AVPGDLVVGEPGFDALDDLAFVRVALHGDPVLDADDEALADPQEKITGSHREEVRVLRDLVGDDLADRTVVTVEVQDTRLAIVLVPSFVVHVWVYLFRFRSRSCLALSFWRWTRRCSLRSAFLI